MRSGRLSTLDSKFKNCGMPRAENWFQTGKCPAWIKRQLRSFHATIWETASPADRAWSTGWVGRYFDHECRTVPGAMLGLRVGEQAALAFAGERARAATLASPALLEVPATGALKQGMETVNRVEPTGIEALDFIQRTGNETQALARRLREVVRFSLVMNHL